MSQPHSNAVVIGGGIAGLLAARVLAKFFGHVTIIDRDYDTASLKPSARRGVPQSVQPHALFAKGYRILEELFPGIGEELASYGAVSLDWAREFSQCWNGRWSAAAKSSSIRSYTCSRPLLEWVIQRRVSKISSIYWKQERVAGLISDSNSNRIVGIKTSSNSQSGPIEIRADLVVDASGRSTNAPAWLKALGFEAPPVTVVNPFLGYASRRFFLPVRLVNDWKVMLIHPTPPDRLRVGYLGRIENGEVIAMIGGYGKDYPPLSDEEFLRHARTLSSPHLYEAIKAAQPSSPIYSHKATENRWYRYEQSKVPDGFVALGDSVCALCPFYGQGMSVAALGVAELQRWLEQSLLKSQTFQVVLAKSIEPQWKFATTQDSRFPSTKGRITGESIGELVAMHLEQIIYDRTICKVTKDADLYKEAMAVGNLLKPESEFFTLENLLRILF